MADLHVTAERLAAVLWREHTLYRERDGGVVIRAPHIGRWISLRVRGRDTVQVRAGRLLDGGTTAPARAEGIARVGEDVSELAALCRRLLAEATQDAAVPRPAYPSAGAERRRWWRLGRSR
ncbi:hypothetical protein ACFQLX_07110 [Streptomyces polyrhachis]|uniref:Uncharacterized protein n=1 Tax=Streptomyces polyrhachis TaxID=1282885 RepID=A0ABW2GDT3_9ACTN